LEQTLDVAREWLIAHVDWIGPVLAFTAFGESLPIVGVLLPGSTFLMAAGTLIPLGVIDGWSMAAWVIPGAILGDALAYWLGQRFGGKILAMWPLRNHPEMIEQCRRFFDRWGSASVFVGRFSGPVRSTAPLLAGMMAMPKGRFWIANVASAVVWAPFLMSPGFLLVAITKWWETAGGIERLIGGMVLANLAVGGLFAWRWWTRRQAAAQAGEADSKITKV